VNKGGRRVGLRIRPWPPSAAPATAVSTSIIGFVIFPFVLFVLFVAGNFVLSTSVTVVLSTSVTALA